MILAACATERGATREVAGEPASVPEERGCTMTVRPAGDVRGVAPYEAVMDQ